jgi:hypothetical protein
MAKAIKSKIQVSHSVRQIDNGFIIRTEKTDGMKWSSSEKYSKTNPLDKLK